MAPGGYSIRVSHRPHPVGWLLLIRALWSDDQYGPKLALPSGPLSRRAQGRAYSEGLWEVKVDGTDELKKKTQNINMTELPSSVATPI